MAWTLITVMAWVTSVSAVRYADYRGAKMPQYGSNEYEIVQDLGHSDIVGEDYHGHSPDASSSFDYKYEDERSGKAEKQIEESDNTVNWNMPARKHREILRPPHQNNLEIIDKYVPETETATKFKVKRHFLKHRSRLKSKNFHEDEETSSRWSAKSYRVKKFDSDITKSKFDEHGNEIRDDTWEEPDNEHYRPREITEKVIRRMPRDKFFNRIHSNVEAPNDDIQLDRKMKNERRLKVDYMPEDEDRDQRRQRRPYKPFSDEEEDQEAKEPDRPKLKGYEDYGDYYDMKRVHNIKNKLPMLVRRPTAGMGTTVAAGSDVTGVQRTYRRKNLPVSIPQESSTSTLFTSSSIFTSTTLKLIHTDEVPNSAHEELSLAEKSKLSIMKKAQRKESMHMGKLSTKPPVLLQVTKKMLTVVVVEPPTSAVPWMRANVLDYDTPERMERAKKLMRNKLVARARNIQDLTDNWDEMICDYIDVSMLDRVTQTSQNYVGIVTEIFLLFLVL